MMYVQPRYQCLTFGAARMDCALSAIGPRGARTCIVVHSVQVDRSGLAGFRPYACPKARQPLFRTQPNWLRSSQDPLLLEEPWPPFYRRSVIPAPLLSPPPLRPS
jgi:hypothetical protein